MKRDKVQEALKKYQIVSRQAQAAMNRAHALQVKALVALEKYEKVKARVNLKTWKQLAMSVQVKEKANADRT